jgi:hypothetical protein
MTDSEDKKVPLGRLEKAKQSSGSFLKKYREEKLCISFVMTGKCEKPHCKFGHKCLDGKRVAFQGMGVNMMNFLTNVTNEERHESGVDPVVKVPVGSVMRFPIHFTFL